MVLGIKRLVWRVIGIVAMVSLLVPVVTISFKLITTGQDAVVVLEDASPLGSLLILSYYILLMTVVLVAGLTWLIKQVRLVINLKREQRKTELLYLQSQISPHFFFNVLNNLYGLVDKDTVKAKHLILMLSEMMRYSIYDGQNEVVTIAKEVGFLKSYIDLHKNRYHKKIDVAFVTDIEDGQLKVSPLLFIILVENAFKHGVEHLRTDAYVFVKLVVRRDTISFEVENNFDPEEVKMPNGVGLSNLKRRLALVYPNRHSLSSSQTDTVYKVRLKLKPL
ncbi:MAG: sensor histidine kinase [Phaeodactylibacter sp.]|nr:sensor histidine kinase [Phaeodactylibacter sp.]